MKIAAFSDSHGCLADTQIYPLIEADTDVVCIAGDIIPLDIQRDPYLSDYWLTESFFRWVDGLNVKKVFWVAGNHDFELKFLGKEKIKEMIFGYGLANKLVYLFDESYEFDGKKFFGTPWIKDLRNWAFYSPDLNESFKCIEDCDVLITHIPPKVEKVGCSNPYESYERDFGSIELTKVLEDKDIKVNVCGHIHTGVHGGVKYGNTIIYNVSLLNEDYREAFPVTYFEI